MHNFESLKTIQVVSGVFSGKTSKIQGDVQSNCTLWLQHSASLHQSGESMSSALVFNYNIKISQHSVHQR